MLSIANDHHNACIYNVYPSEYWNKRICNFFLSSFVLLVNSLSTFKCVLLMIFYNMYTSLVAYKTINCLVISKKISVNLNRISHSKCIYLHCIKLLDIFLLFHTVNTHMHNSVQNAYFCLLSFIYHVCPLYSSLFCSFHPLYWHGHLWKDFITDICTQFYILIYDFSLKILSLVRFYDWHAILLQ